MNGMVELCPTSYEARRIYVGYGGTIKWGNSGAKRWPKFYALGPTL